MTLFIASILIYQFELHWGFYVLACVLYLPMAGFILHMYTNGYKLFDSKINQIKKSVESLDELKGSIQNIEKHVHKLEKSHKTAWDWQLRETIKIQSQLYEIETHSKE